jgi:tetraacyldisaccharide 4'-kinase
VNPLSGLFGLVVGARNRLYDNGAFAQNRLAHPVISVGNLSVGGSGKTPFVMLLGRLLQERKLAFDILSRGYKRHDNTIRLVDPKGKVALYGDEPLLLAREFEVPVIVGSDRFAAGRHAETLFKDARPAHGEWMHLLDDGFQHRRLARDFDIVLLSRDDLCGQLLPAGRLREPLLSLRRADAVILTDDTPEQDLPDFARKKHIWRVTRELSLATPAPAKTVAFCGVAQPERLLADLRSLGVSPAETRQFPDHHRYTQIDVESLLSLRQRTGAEAFITTAKDIINLESAGLLNALQPVIELKLRMRFVAPTADEIFSAIVSTIAERRRRLAPRA